MTERTPSTRAGRELYARRAYQNGTDLTDKAAMSVLAEDILAIETEARADALREVGELRADATRRADRVLVAAEELSAALEEGAAAVRGLDGVWKLDDPNDPHEGPEWDAVRASMRRRTAAEQALLAALSQPPAPDPQETTE